MSGTASSVTRESIQQSAEFLTALFGAGDVVLFRSIEVWSEDSRKHSLVDGDGTAYVTCGIASMRSALARQVELLAARSAETRCNVSFGVAPRLGRGGFNQAWQIRKLNALWMDIDNVTVEDALSRVEAAGLPSPSIVVNSGNGVHLYWLLAEPFLIDDVGQPAKVLKEGEDPWRKYIFDEDKRSKLYLDQARNVPDMSVKALFAQDVLQGIAAAVGGDRTHDLSRLLRVPNTFNRKDQRNGADPKLCTIAVMRADLRYQFEQFAPFSSQSPDRAKREKIARVKLPTSRKPTARTEDRLNDLITACDAAPVGYRSDADWSLVCYAIEKGVPQSDLWSRVQSIGKFAEGGEKYFLKTWERAESHTRCKVFAKAESKSGDIPGKTNGIAQPQGGDSKANNNVRDIRISPSEQPVSAVMSSITSALLSTNRCFLRAGQLVTVHDDQLRFILKSTELAGLIAEICEVMLCAGKGATFEPLPQKYGSTWLNQHVERNRLPAVNLYTQHPVYVQEYRLTQPGLDHDSGVYTAGAPITPRDNTECLDLLLNGFCWKSTGDRTNYIGVLLTFLLISKFIGSKPAVLFGGNQPELGKTILAQIIAILRDGHPVETVTFNPNEEEFEKRLATRVRKGASVLIIDNAKGSTIESGVLERCITDPILSFRLLGGNNEICVENSLIFAITANTPEVSRDIFTRSVVVNLYHEGDPNRRVFAIQDPEGYAQENRDTILGELAGMVERWKAAGMPKAKTDTRFNKRGWGNIIGGILELNGDPDFDNCADAAEEIDATRREFAALVSILAASPRGSWTAKELADIARKNNVLNHQIGGGSERSRATKAGLLASRYVAERFELSKERVATFHKDKGTDGPIYKINIDEKNSEAER